MAAYLIMYDMQLNSCIVKNENRHIESIKTTSMENVGTGVLNKDKDTEKNAHSYIVMGVESVVFSQIGKWR